jgi:hypothetical protein
MRPKVPRQIQLANVPPGTTAGSNAGDYISVNALITARLTGDDAAFFSIAQLETFDVEREPDTRPPRDVLVPALKITGAGPIQAFQDEAILATVDFACPADPLKISYKATVILEGAGLSTPITVAVNAAPRRGILQAINLSAPLIAPNETVTFTFRVTSTFGHDVLIAFRYLSAFEPLFSAPTVFPPPAPSNGSVDFGVLITCLPSAPEGTRNAQFQILSADLSEVLGSMELGITVVLPPPPKHIPVDPSIVWEETTDLSISSDAAQNAWHAGRIKDILLRSDAMFVAASTGGVWGINSQDFDAPAGCTTDDVDNPNFNCMAFGPDSPLQIYAGCASMRLGAGAGTGLYLRGLSEWRQIPIVDGFGIPQLTDDIFRILVLPIHRVILLATMRGVFISFIPGAGEHAFAGIQSLPDGSYSGMCEGPNETVAVSLSGPNGGIFLGTWSGSQLIFSPAQMIPDPSQNNGDIDLTQVANTSLASCGSNRSIMYAVFASKVNNSIYRILRSDTGGASWRPLRTLGNRVAESRLAPLAPDNQDPNFNDNMAGFTGHYTNCIAVAFHDSNEVGIGWANGPWLTSNASDVLTRWTLAYESANSSQVHGDIQTILFDPSDPSDNTIYVGSDGGVTFTLDRAGDGGYQSRLSKHVRNLQFYSSTPPGKNGATGETGGGISASPTVPGLIAGPTQDNGNLFCALESPDTKGWQTLDGGDGIVMRFLSDGLLLSVSPNDNTPPPRRARLSRWNGTAFADPKEVPVTSPSASALSVFGDVQPVTKPSFTLPDTQKLLFAVASTANAGGQLINAYGLFTDGTIGNAEWQLIATLPLQSGDSISSIASLNGHQVFAGTRQGRVFSFAPFQRPFELVVSPADKGPVHDIVVVRDALAFALYDGPATKAILQSEFFNWDPLGSNENVARGVNLEGSEPYVALIIDRETSPQTLYACTDTRVFVSRDEGNTWLLATTHLPSRVHCTGFAVGAARPGGRYLYLSTYGRSVWQAKI